VTLTDQKSANGTWVGDQRITEKQLAHMDRFRVGHTVFEVVLEGAEAEEGDLELAQTSAIPLADVLQSLKMRAVSKLEEEGEEVLVSGNRPFFLDDPSSMWLVESGRMDIFTVTVKDGEAAGARSFFVGAEPDRRSSAWISAATDRGRPFSPREERTRLRKDRRRPARRARRTARARRADHDARGGLDPRADTRPRPGPPA